MSDNSELVAAIAAGVALALEKGGHADKQTQQTSIDSYSPPEVTVRFLKWTAMGGTAYMRGQMAGFPRSQIAPYVKAGRCEITHEFDQPIAGRR